MFKNLIYEKEGVLGILKVNRPDKLNALNNETVAEMRAAVAAIEADDSLRVLIVTGQGEKSFVAGADINELKERDAFLGRAHTRERQELFSRLENMNIPVIAAVNGFALGAGLELALACTLRLAADNAKFGAPEVKLGIIPGDGGTQRLPRLIGKGRAMELILTGEMIDANEAYRIGLANRIVPAAELLNEARKLANLLAERPPLAVRYGKEAVNRGMDLGLDSGFAHESYLFALLCTTEDKKEGVNAFLEKRKGQFTGR
jgi:enoyl-CoA hydratase